MTNEEALEKLKYIYYILHRAYAEALDYGETNYEEFKADVEAVCMAIDTLGKQIPKKVNRRYAMSWCPSCDDMIDQRTTKPIRHCVSCGQALDWEE